MAVALDRRVGLLHLVEPREGGLRPVLVGEVAERLLDGLRVARAVVELLVVRLKVNFLTSPFPAEVATNSATSRISSSLSLSLNAGMVPPPFRTWRSTRSAFGRTSSRFGPTVAVAPAASSVWQPPQFASAKTLAPLEVATPVSVAFLSPPPQPADTSSTAAKAARAEPRRGRTTSH